MADAGDFNEFVLTFLYDLMKKLHFQQTILINSPLISQFFNYGMGSISHAAIS